MVSKHRNIVVIAEIVRAISGEVRGKIRIWKKNEEEKNWENLLKGL